MIIQSKRKRQKNKRINEHDRLTSLYPLLSSYRSSSHWSSSRWMIEKIQLTSFGRQVDVSVNPTGQQRLHRENQDIIFFIFFLNFEWQP